MEISQFHRRSASLDGYDNKCKVCRNLMSSTPQTLTDAAEQIRIPATEILEDMGYIIEHPTLSVYEQFKMKWKDRGVDTSKW